MATQLEIAKEALAQIGTRSKITSLTDGSAEAQYVNLLYAPIRDFLLTDGDYDWSMAAAALVPVVSRSSIWDYEYTYPTSALRIRQVIPAAIDMLDPRPIAWVVAVAAGASARAIFTSQPAASALYTTPAAEAAWDGIFHQSFVRMLASALAFALENRIEASKVKLDEALGFAGVGKMRDM